MNRIPYLLLLLFLSLRAYAEEPQWTRVGPDIGSIVSIVPDRLHPQVWFAIEAPDGRLYRSIDNGKSWKYTNQKYVGQVLVHSVSSEVFIRRRGSSRDSQLLSSVDQGRTFKLLANKTPWKIFDHPTDPKILWGAGFLDFGYDLMISFDRGKHWQEFSNLPYKLGKEYNYGIADYYELADLLVSPFDPQTIYVSMVVGFTYSQDEENYVRFEFVTTDSGKTWKSKQIKAYNYFYDPAFPDRAFSISYPQQLNVLTPQGWKLVSEKVPGNIVSVPGRPNELFAIAAYRQYFSRDGGINWDRTAIGPGAGARIVAARTFPEGSLLVGTSGAGLYEIDSRLNSNLLNISFKESFVTKVATAPHSSIIYIIAGEGDHYLYRSMNSGKTWDNITDNLPLYVSAAAGPYDLFVDPNNQRHVFVGVKDKIAVSFDAGRNWSYVPQIPLREVFFDPDGQTMYFAKRTHAHLFVSNDGGRTLQELPAQFGEKHNTIYDFAIDRFTGRWYLATNYGLFVSKDHGKSAQQIATDLFNCISCVPFYQIISLEKPGYLLAVTEAGIYKSTNQGKTWQNLTKRKGQLSAVDKTGQHLFLVDYLLYESTDGAITWDVASSGIASDRSFEVTSISDPRYRPLYLSTSVGLFSTVD